MKLRQMTAIIAEEIKCPAWIPGVRPEFSYCCDRDEEPRGCFCENAALRIIAQQESITQPKGACK